jgi:chromosome condensin MukBEF ATPase and DNA-binding subunit MukB
MRRKILLFISIIGITLVLQADDYDKLETLKKERSELLLQMHNKRTELIKKTPSLMELQKKIIALHKELAIRIDNNEEMRELANKLRTVETQINNLEQ